MPILLKILKQERVIKRYLMPRNAFIMQKKQKKEDLIILINIKMLHYMRKESVYNI